MEVRPRWRKGSLSGVAQDLVTRPSLFLIRPKDGVKTLKGEGWERRERKGTRGVKGRENGKALGE